MQGDRYMNILFETNLRIEILDFQRKVRDIIVMHQATLPKIGALHTVSCCLPQ